MPVRLTVGLCLAILLCPALAAAQSATPAAITIDASKRHQTIDGFGTCLISWVPKFERLYNTPKFQQIYADELGCSMMRINLWGPVMPKPVEDWRQIRYQDFVLTGEGRRTRLFIDAGKGFKRVNPQMRFIGTAWSPPAWMKENNAIVDKATGAIGGDGYTRQGRTFDNRVKTKYFPHFARWLVEMAKLHRAEGVPLYAISPGNEVMFTQTFESCVWSAEDLATVIALLGEQLEAEGLGEIKIFGPETMTSHNWSPDLANELYIKTLKGNAAAWKQFDVWATHGYTDGFTTDKSKDSTAIYWGMIKDTGKPFWITEGGTGGHDWPAALHEMGAMLHNALVGGNASAFVPWQISEEKKSEHGLMVMDEFTGKTRAAQHYFKFIRPGAVRVDATPGDGPVPASAYVHEGDKTLTIVLTNPTKGEQAVTIELSGGGMAGVREMKVFRTSAREQFKELDEAAVKDGKIELTLPAESMVTLHGSTGVRS
jgi:glucuronoarabinoxylan endo-1,4-beta-xylanase